MRRASTTTRIVLGVVLVALLAVPALSLGGRGQLVGKDVGTGKSPVAVAQATVKNPGRMSLTIATKPRNKKVDWTYTSDCEKNGESFRYPPPGEHVTKSGRSKIKAPVKFAVDDPERCTVYVSGKLDYEAGKKVIAKIFHQG